MSAATIPTELVGPSGRAASKMSPPDVLLRVVAAYLGRRHACRHETKPQHMSVCGTYLINLL